jgi:tRNA threonylcarbamoyl adenosine modification protein (Sua5/YciO/YrdC/YwlC family)
MSKAQVFKINTENPQVRLIRQAIDILNNNGLIVHPTDSTYAIGAHIKNKRGIEKLYQLKKKSLLRPLSFLCKDLSDIAEFAKVGDTAYRTMKRLLPGPYTFILDAKKTAPRVTQYSHNEIGIRVPNDAICQAIIEGLGQPLISTSAYVHGGEILADPEDIIQVLGGHVDLIIDAGTIFPEPSTIISFLGQEPELVRQGKGEFIIY